MDVLWCHGAQNIGLSSYKLVSAVKCTVWLQCTPVPDRQTNIMAIASTRSVSLAEITRSLHWLPIRQRIHCKLALLDYKARHSMLPSYLQNLLSDHHPIRQLRSSSAHLFSKPAVTSTFASQAFSVSVQLYGTHSTLTCVLLTLLAHLNLSLRAHCSLQLMTEWNSTFQSHPALLIHSLPATRVLYKLYIVLCCNDAWYNQLEENRFGWFAKLSVSKCHPQPTISPYTQ